MTLQACCGPVSTEEPPVFPFAGSFPPNGHIFYRDDYDQLYEVTWETLQVGDDFLLDFTVITKQPYVWGEPNQGFVKDRTVYRRGICTVWRYIIGPHDDGYIILAEGMSQIICTFQTSFNCVENPQDNFVHHVDSYVCATVKNLVSCGPRFSDPDNPGDVPVAFGHFNTAGEIEADPGTQLFQFVSVWDQDDDLTSICEPTGATS